MNKKEFLKQLEENLAFLRKKEREEIIKDYQEHFISATSAGKNESEIIKKLGSPKTIARSYMFEAEIAKSDNKFSLSNIVNGIIVTLSLGFFNLVFVFGLYMGIIGLFIGFFVMSLSFSAVGVGVIIYSLSRTAPFWVSIPFVLENLNLASRLSLTLFGIGFISLSVMLTVVFIYIGKFIYLGTINYIKSNISLVRKAAGINE